MLYSLKTPRVSRLSPMAVGGSDSVSGEEMVGTTGFEPATSRTPSVRATRLRYVPTGKLTTIRQGIGRTQSQQRLRQTRHTRRASRGKTARKRSADAMR